MHLLHQELAQAPVILWTQDATGAVTSISTSWTDVTGYPTRHALGSAWLNAIHPDDRERVARVQAAHQAEPQEYSVSARLITKDGREREVSTFARPVYGENRRFEGFIGSATDVTGRLRPALPSYISQIKATGHPHGPCKSLRRKPTVSFDLDGTLCNILQGVLDTAIEIGVEGMFSWEDARCAKNCRVCSSSLCMGTGAAGSNRMSGDAINRATRAALTQPDFYRNLQPFDVEDMELLRWHLAARSFVGHFVATRKDLDIPGTGGDARVQTMAWLEGFQIANYMGIVADAHDVARELKLRGVQYHLDDDPDEVGLVRAAGIEAFLLDRPWNQHVDCAYRVERVEQFLEIAAPEAFAEEETAACLDEQMVLAGR